jgi:hypothetical protein
MNPYTDMYEALFSVKKKYHMQITWVGFERMTFAMLKQMSYNYTTELARWLEAAQILGLRNWVTFNHINIKKHYCASSENSCCFCPNCLLEM